MLDSALIVGQGLLLRKVTRRRPVQSVQRKILPITGFAECAALS
jgi:hypothetical protein